MSSIDYKYKAKKYKSKFLSLQKEYDDLLEQIKDGDIQNGGKYLKSNDKLSQTVQQSNTSYKVNSTKDNRT